MAAMHNTSPLAGFQNAAAESNHVFRAVLDAMSRPGKIVGVSDLAAPAGLNPAANAILLTLADMDTPIWLADEIATEQAINHIRFHTGAEVTSDPSRAHFAIASAETAITEIAKLSSGTPEAPHQSATLILLVEALNAAPAFQMTGPGIKTKETLGVTPLPDGFLDWAQANSCKFPCGVDVIFASPASLAALPRSSQIEVN